MADLFSTNFVESKSRNSAHGSPVQRRLVCSRRYGNWIARNGPAQLSATLISGRVRILQNLASLSCTRERGLHIDLFRSYCTVQSARVFRCFTLSWETALRCFRSEFTEFHNGRLYKSQQGGERQAHNQALSNDFRSHLPDRRNRRGVRTAHGFLSESRGSG